MCQSPSSSSGQVSTAGHRRQQRCLELAEGVPGQALSCSECVAAFQQLGNMSGYAEKDPEDPPEHKGVDIQVHCTFYAFWWFASILQAEAVQLVALRPFDGICKRSTTLSSASRGK